LVLNLIETSKNRNFKFKHAWHFLPFPEAIVKQKLSSHAFEKKARRKIENIVNFLC